MSGGWVTLTLRNPSFPRRLESRLSEMDVSAVGYLDSGLRRKDGVGCCRDDAVTPLIWSLSKDLHECDSQKSALALAVIELPGHRNLRFKNQFRNTMI